jgi:hypothetical protein
MYQTTNLLTDTVSQLISLGGIELSNSRRYVDLTECDAVRYQYGASNSIIVRLDFSVDFGQSWQTLVDEYAVLGTSPRITAWQTLPDDSRTCDVLLRAVAIGSGLLTSVNFIEVNTR